MIVWGNKVTGDISGPLSFHTSKVVAQKYLQQQKKNKWTSNQFEEVDWEHLEQTSGFCSTRVQVGLYSGGAYLDKRCPNCGAKETDAHLMRFLDEDCTRLLIDNMDELTMWLEMDGTTHPELLYLIPKYILMRNDKPFSQLGHMSPQMRSLAESQDKIGWRNFTRGTS